MPRGGGYVQRLLHRLVDHPEVAEVLPREVEHLVADQQADPAGHYGPGAALGFLFHGRRQDPPPHRPGQTGDTGELELPAVLTVGVEVLTHRDHAAQLRAVGV